MIKKRLFTPGPVSVYPAALAAALDANIHHRTVEFREILADVMASLKKAFGNPDQVYLFASSGSGAMEAAVTNHFSPGDEVLVATCGKFGERWVEITRQYGLKVDVLRYDYGAAVLPEDIEKKLKENSRISGVFLQACESSTGVQNDIDTIAWIVRNTEALLVIDAVTGLGTMRLSPASGMDVLVSGSQKALMIPPGLGFIAITEKAWKRVEKSTMPRFYFDLRAARKSFEKDGQTPFTPATSLVVSLQKSLKMIEEIGWNRLIQWTENRAKATRAGLAALQLEIFASRPANALTAIKAPEGDADKITGQLKQRFGLQIAGGQGEMKGKIFRISHMGYIDHFDILAVLSALEWILKSLGHPVRPGSSLEAFQNVFAEVV